MPLPSLAEIPQLQTLQSQVRCLWAAQMVVVLASERGLWIAWPSNEEWQVAAGSWPDGCCRDGMPLQREAMAELLADLLLERRLVEAQNTLDLREQQQEVLLDLIAGQDRIQTFLALLGQEARASGVEIRRHEPLAAPFFSKVDRTAIAVVPTNKA